LTQGGTLLIDQLLDAGEPVKNNPKSTYHLIGWHGGGLSAELLMQKFGVTEADRQRIHQLMKKVAFCRHKPSLFLQASMKLGKYCYEKFIILKA
jgi:hypothetical protein